MAPAMGHMEAWAPDDERIAQLLPACRRADAEIQSLEPLYAAHGDAHARNLLPTAAGWRWLDFEDASLMPRLWDIASFITNTALFHGFAHPVCRYALAASTAAADKAALAFALKARAIMAVTTNLSLARRGHGDLAFAEAQLARVPGFLARMDEGL